ncbi:MAG: SRPBCC domain-containing protein [Bacteroidota bacterium]|nr:SRPBCC domain-containing protein [Bacteroidota bacterium]
MKQQDYQCAISANITAGEAFEKISQVAKWWSKSFKGKSQKPGDTFSVRFGETFVDFKIGEVIPDKKIVWEVTDCNLHWIENKTEWKNTKIVWEVLPENSKTNISMTHVGLVPGVECYNDCKIGWDGYIQKSLFDFLTENKGLPDKF